MELPRRSLCRLDSRSLLWSTVIAVALLPGLANSQQASRREPVIAVGHSLDEVAAVLRERKIKLVRAGFQEMKHPGFEDTEGDLIFDLGPEMFVRLYYSKSAQRLTGMSICTFPKDNQSKTTYSSFPAASMRFEENGDFSIRFIGPPRER